MSIELDALGEVWLTCKEYIGAKDRQAAADHVLAIVADHNITESDLKAFASTDSYLKRSLKEYLGEDENDTVYDDDDVGDDY